MQEKLKNSLNYAPKEALVIISQYLPHPYACFSCCQDQEIEEVSEQGKESLRKLRKEFNNLIVPIHLKKSFFNEKGNKNKATGFNISKTIEILSNIGDPIRYPGLPENCKIALNQLKVSLEQNANNETSALLGHEEREQESYQAH